MSNRTRRIIGELSKMNKTADGVERSLEAKKHSNIFKQMQISKHTKYQEAIRLFYSMVH